MLKNNFCSSPWFHLRLTYSGDFEECRFIHRRFRAEEKIRPNISDTSIMEFYNSSQMKDLRKSLLNGDSPKLCESCYEQDKFGLINGRKRQLLKSGIQIDNFELTARSSPHYEHFLHSYKNDGHSEYYPVDLQIDLGNLCNSACVMCNPRASTRLQQDYKKLYKIEPDIFKNPKQFKSWTRDEVLVKKFVNEIRQIPNIKYIHFLGGETLYDETFFQICEALIEDGISKNIIVGTTTNGTIYNERMENIIKKFKEFHLGISIETVTPLNDYIRYPSDVNEVISNTKKYLELRKDSKLYVSLRITPNIFTVYDLDKLFEFMIENNVIAEACDILHEPDCLRIELLPENIRKQIVGKLNNLIKKYNLSKSTHLNIRVNHLISEVIGNSIIDYSNFLNNYKVLENAEELRFKLVKFLKSFESIRNNSILDYAPQYKEFLRTYGY